MEMIELDLLGGGGSDKDTGSCIKAFSPRLIPSCCSLGIANSKIYRDCSLSNRPQTNILQLRKGGPEETSRALHNCLNCHAEEGTGPGPQGDNDRKADLGSRGEDCSSKKATCTERASCVWKERSEGYVPRLCSQMDLVSLVLLPLLTVPPGQGLNLLKMPFLMSKTGVNIQTED